MSDKSAETCYIFEALLRSKFPAFNKKIQFKTAQKLIQQELGDGCPALRHIGKFETSSMLAQARFTENLIILKRGSFNLATVLHEIAHFQSRGHGHGQQFMQRLTVIYKKHFGLSLIEQGKLYQEAVEQSATGRWSCAA